MTKTAARGFADICKGKQSLKTIAAQYTLPRGQQTNSTKSMRAGGAGGQSAQSQIMYTQPQFYSPLHSPQNWNVNDPNGQTLYQLASPEMIAKEELENSDKWLGTPDFKDGRAIMLTLDKTRKTFKAICINIIPKNQDAMDYSRLFVEIHIGDNPIPRARIKFSDFVRNSKRPLNLSANNESVKVSLVGPAVELEIHVFLL